MTDIEVKRVGVPEKINSLINYLSSNFIDVRVIGTNNPSVIITYEDISYVIYQLNKDEFVICYCEERYTCTQNYQVKKYIKQTRKK